MPVLRNCQLYTYHSVIYPRAARHRPDNPVSFYRLIIEPAHSDRDLRLGTPSARRVAAVCAHRYRSIYLAYSLSTLSIPIYIPVYTLHMHIFLISLHTLHTIHLNIIHIADSTKCSPPYSVHKLQMLKLFRRSRKLTGSGQSCSFPGLSLRRFRPAVRIFSVGSGCRAFIGFIYFYFSFVLVYLFIFLVKVNYESIGKLGIQHA